MVSNILTPQGRFDYAFTILLAHEGGYSNDPKDIGGPTKYGITQEDVNQHWAALNLPKDVKNVTIDDAKIFYKSVWWDKYHYNAINALRVATKIFDMAVNIGPIHAHEIAQKSCNCCGHHLDVDGYLGGKTFGALNEITLHGREEDLMLELVAYQNDFYGQLIKQHPHLQSFEQGWITRASWMGE